jgi:hypothetical protein
VADLAAEKAADDAGGGAAAAVDEAGETAGLQRDDEVVRPDRRDVEGAAEQVRIVARKEDGLARLDLHRRLALDAEERAAGEDVVEADEMRGAADEAAAIRRLDLRDDAPRRGEFRIEKDTPGEPHEAKHVRKRVHGRATRPKAGGSVKRSGGSIISGFRRIV